MKLPVYIKNLATGSTYRTELDLGDIPRVKSDYVDEDAYEADDVNGYYTIPLTTDVFGEYFPAATNRTVPRFTVTNMTGSWTYQLYHKDVEKENTDLSDGTEEVCEWTIRYLVENNEADPLVIGYKMIPKVPIQYYMKDSDGKLKNVYTQYVIPNSTAILKPVATPTDAIKGYKFTPMGNHPTSAQGECLLTVGRRPEKIGVEIVYNDGYDADSVTLKWKTYPRSPAEETRVAIDYNISIPYQKFDTEKEFAYAYSTGSGYNDLDAYVVAGTWLIFDDVPTYLDVDGEEGTYGDTTWSAFPAYYPTVYDMDENYLDIESYSAEEERKMLAKAKAKSYFVENVHVYVPDPDGGDDHELYIPIHCYPQDNGKWKVAVHFTDELIEMFDYAPYIAFTIYGTARPNDTEEYSIQYDVYVSRDEENAISLMSLAEPVKRNKLPKKTR